MSHTITREIALPVEPARAYELIAHAKNVEQWFCDACEINGKTFKATWNNDNGPITLTATITDSTPSSRFIYVEDGDHGTITAFALSAANEGTTLTLTETFPPDTPNLEATVEEHRMGWDYFLGRLTSLA